MNSKRKEILIMGVNILSGRRTGGMLITAKVYEYLAKQAGLHIDYVELSHVINLNRFRLMSLYLLFRYRKQYDYIIIDGTIYYFLYLIISKLRGTQIVCLYYHFLSREPESLKRTLLALREMALVRIADKSVFISNRTFSDALELGLAGRDFAVAKPGLDKEFWVDRTAGYNPYSEEFNVICVGNLIKRKGIRDLIRAFEQLLNALKAEHDASHVKLNIVGDDRVDPVITVELKHYIASHGLSSHVAIKGWHGHTEDELVRCYRGASVFVLPSYYEGFGIVVMEAASFGLPLIVSDAGALPEVVQEGKYGFIFKVGDIDSLEEKLMMLYRDHKLRSLMSKHAASLYRESISWDEFGRQVAEYLSKD